VAVVAALKLTIPLLKLSQELYVADNALLQFMALISQSVGSQEGSPEVF
jgi:hypothetical protein